MIKKICSIRILVFVGMMLVSSNAQGMFGDFKGNMQNIIGQEVIKIIGTALIAMLDDSVKLYRWSYNKLFPHVANIENGLLRMNQTINEIDTKIGTISDNIKVSTRLLVNKIKQLPNKQDVESTLMVLHQIFVQEQQRCTASTQGSLAHMEVRLNERFVQLEETISDKLTAGRHKVDTAQHEVNQNQSAMGNKLSSLIEGNQQVLGALAPVHNFKDVTVKK